jgi:ubiquinone/menaquinone biosynthesis C-methylase UbiE
MHFMDSIVYFKALSDITRIRLFNILLHHELSVNEIVSIMDMGQSRISRHLKILIDAGILMCRRDGIWAFYSVVDQGPGLKFAESIRYLLEEEPFFEKDLVRSKQIFDDRMRKTVNFFNSIASEWDLLKKDILGDLDLNEIIVSHIEKCSVAVDLGCGTGDLLLKMKKVADNVIGVDSSSRMLEETRKRFQSKNGGIDLRLGEMEHLPLGNNEADCAVVSMVLHHLSNPGAVFSEANRILRQKGTFIIVDFDKHKHEAMRTTYGDRWLGFSIGNMEKWLINHGFVINGKECYKLKKSLTLNLLKAAKQTKI